MAVNETPDDVETVSIPVASAPPDFIAIGKPWSTGLFDCYENQTNGIIFILLSFLFFLTFSLQLDIALKASC